MSGYAGYVLMLEESVFASFSRIGPAWECTIFANGCEHTALALKMESALELAKIERLRSENLAFKGCKITEGDLVNSGSTAENPNKNDPKA